MLALQVLARYPAMLRTLFVRTLPDIGAYELRLCVSGTWVPVVVDDYLPCDSDGCLIGISSTNPNEIWAPLLEKAWAKLYGGYDRLERGSSLTALADLTGGMCHNVVLRDHRRAKAVLQDDSYWSALRAYLKEGCIVGAMVKSSSACEQQALRESGIAANRMYEVLQMVETQAWKVLQLRVCHEKSGAESGGGLSSVWLDEEWMRKLPESDYRVMHAAFHEPRSVPDSEKLWICLENFAIYFNKVYFCRTPANVSSDIGAACIQTVRSRWLGRTAGGRLRCKYFTENPCYCIRVKDKDTPILLRLSQPDCRLRRKDAYEHAVGMYVVKSDDPAQKKRHWEKEDVVCIPKFYKCRDAYTEVLCQPGVNYFVIPCTADGGVEMRFQLTAVSALTYIVHEVDCVDEVELSCKGEWAGFSAGGRTSGGETWTNNPMYCLRVDDHATPVAFILHQETPAGRVPYYITLSVYKSEGVGRILAHNPDALVLSPDFAPHKTIFTSTTLEKGVYTVMPMTWAQGEEATFTLSVVTAGKVVLYPLFSLLRSERDEQTAAVEPLTDS